MPSLTGRRLTVYDIVTKLDIEPTIEDALIDYEITISDAKAATEYCMNLCCKEDIKRIHFCDGCILRTIEEGWDFKKGDYEQVNDFLTISKDKTFMFLGNLQQLEEEQFGKPGWAIASEIYKLLNFRG